MIQIDMPMPERCGVCFAIHDDEIGLESWCGIDETARDLYTADINTKRPEWCPLKEQEGEWLDVDDEQNAFDCSICGAMVRRKCLYCPGCGTRMRNGTRATTQRNAASY